MLFIFPHQVRFFLLIAFQIFNNLCFFSLFPTLSSKSKDSEPDAWNTEQSTGKLMPLMQFQLNNLTQDLNLTKESIQLLEWLHEHNLLASLMTYFWHQHRYEGFKKCFRYDEDHFLVYCQDVSGLISALEIVYILAEWQLFLDSSVKSLKVVLIICCLCSCWTFSEAHYILWRQNLFWNLFSVVNTFGKYVVSGK